MFTICLSNSWKNIDQLYLKKEKKTITLDYKKKEGYLLNPRPGVKLNF